MLGWDRAIDIVGKVAWEQNTSFVLVAIPMFIFMGELLFQSGIMSTVYLRAATVVSGIPGGLLQANIAACTIFAACSGSSVASAATIGSVGYPEICQARLQQADSARLDRSRRHARHPHPAKHHLHRLRQPGRGLDRQTVSRRRGARAWRCRRSIRSTSPSAAWSIRRWRRRRAASAVGERVRAALGLWQMGLLIVVVLGGIYGGIASPTEVAALGASLAILISLISSKFTFAGLWRAGLATVRQTSMILFVIFTAKILAVTLIYFQVPAAMVAWIGAAEMTAGHIFLAIVLVYLVLGMFVDGIAMMVITIPFIVPIMTNAHMDLVWMGVVVCIMIEVGPADAAGWTEPLRAAGCHRRADA